MISDPLASEGRFVGTDRNTGLARPLAPERFDILVPSAPKRLQITPTMINDMICDPCIAAQIIFKLDLDAFQKNRLRISWWTPRVMDSSGFSSAKTFNMWLVGVLRCILIPNHWILVAYPSFDSMQKVYWKYFKEMASKSPIFLAQIGGLKIQGLDGKAANDIQKAQLKGPGCWTCDFRNASQILAPAVGFMQNARTMAGWRSNDLQCDEHTKSERMKSEGGSTGIDDQLVQRATRASFNQHHPFWCNHQFFCATAEDTMHPSYARYKSFKDEVDKGNPDYFLLSYSMKNISDLPMGRWSGEPGKTFKEVLRIEKVMKDIKKNRTRSGYRQEALGLWSVNGKGWYTGELMSRACEIGRERKIRPFISRHEDPAANDKDRVNNVQYFLGGDPARGESSHSADGTLVVGRAEPRVPKPSKNITDWRFDFIWAYLLKAADATQWASIIHRKMLNFGFTGILLDHGGGGQWIMPELEKTKQMIRDVETRVTPIATLEAESRMVNANFILSMFRNGDEGLKRLWDEHHNVRGLDNLTDLSHQVFQQGFELGIIGFPPGPRETPKEIYNRWTEEHKSAAFGLLHARQQLIRVTYETRDDGTTFLTNHQARRFAARGRKDFAYAAMFAYVRFLQWLQEFDEDDVEDGDGEQVNCFGSRSYVRNRD